MHFKSIWDGKVWAFSCVNGAILAFPAMFILISFFWCHKMLMFMTQKQSWSTNILIFNVLLFSNFSGIAVCECLFPGTEDVRLGHCSCRWAVSSLNRKSDFRCLAVLMCRRFCLQFDYEISNFCKLFWFIKA